MADVSEMEIELGENSSMAYKPAKVRYWRLYVDTDNESTTSTDFHGGCCQPTLKVSSSHQHVI
jgi:hypothetical protein